MLLAERANIRPGRSGDEIDVVGACPDAATSPNPTPCSSNDLFAIVAYDYRSLGDRRSRYRSYSEHFDFTLYS